MTTHTPGPWQRESGSAKAQWVHPVGKPLSYVAMATGDGRENIDANANLIAAAPDLLAAINEMVEAFFVDDDLADLGRQSLAMKMALDAIAKAEGRS